jgi:hypothetical protein
MEQADMKYCSREIMKYRMKNAPGRIWNTYENAAGRYEIWAGKQWKIHQVRYEIFMKMEQADMKYYSREIMKWIWNIGRETMKNTLGKIWNIYENEAGRYEILQ